eukprot:CAMPEP_0185552630 /NCGR_PEP_ID=MMETSP1381-20130426/34423_1 /TAXON_ID=298111 /ORGANISM="Pavlova sp., Strain CCMP459" /LENGTH=89 /DNA_ID=CAMNT_0028165631 /DNA_START=182 /DNA_END=446 /DNA_ORIENTATION=-
MRPAKRLYVRGMRICGFTSMSTPFCDLMYTCSMPALLSGAVQEDEQTLVKYVWPVITWVTLVLEEEVLVVVAVEKHKVLAHLGCLQARA